MIFRSVPEQLENPTTRHYVRVVAFVVLGVCVGALLTLILGPQRLHEIPVTELTETELEATTSAYTLTRSEPVALSIPAIHLDTTFERSLGLNDDKSVEVPDSFDKVGWYRYSPTPGELGPSVILGHVDSYQGAAVFYYIGQLKENDPIYITRRDGSVATFAVTGIGRYEKEGFPNELVYGDIDHAGLRLVTCSGTFDRGTQQYSHNTVVYARLVEPEATTTDME